MTTASTTTTTTAAAATPVRKPKKPGLWSSLTSVTSSIASVVSDLAQTGSVASTGLMIQAESYRLEAVNDLIEQYGSVELLAEAQANANAVVERIRAG